MRSVIRGDPERSVLHLIDSAIEIDGSSIENDDLSLKNGDLCDSGEPYATTETIFICPPGPRVLPQDAETAADGGNPMLTRQDTTRPPPPHLHFQRSLLKDDDFVCNQG